MKYKVRIYALFQFLSLSAVILGIVATLSFVYGAALNGEKISSDFISENFKYIFTFKYERAASIFGSILIYMSLILTVISWAIGFMIVKSKNDLSFYDQIFLIFIVVPIFCNIFALFGQLILRESQVKSTKMSKQDLKRAVKKIQDSFENKNKK